MIRNKEELTKMLKTQLELLNSSCARFDIGYENEALRIATSLRVLLHDTSNSKSLLSQLEIKENLIMLDSSYPIDPQLVNPTEREYIFNGLPGLVGIRMYKGESHFIAPLLLRPGVTGSVDFHYWSENKCIPGEDDERYSRKDLILWLVNKEGGAHVDEKVDNAYKKLSVSSLGITFSVNGVTKRFSNNSIFPSVRQIAWEIIETMNKNRII